jgi:hypothetical protein
MKTKIPTPKPTNGTVNCECGKEHQTGLIPGCNDVYISCTCGAIIHAVIDYDGYSQATIRAGTITRVVEE